MIGNFCDVKEVPSNKFAESPLGKKAESSYFEKSTIRGEIGRASCRERV